jgi:hypothetical protein
VPAEVGAAASSDATGLGFLRSVAASSKSTRLSCLFSDFHRKNTATAMNATARNPRTPGVTRLGSMAVGVVVGDGEAAASRAETVTMSSRRACR